LGGVVLPIEGLQDGQRAPCLVGLRFGLLPNSRLHPIPALASLPQCCQIDPKWLVEMAPRFFKAADPHKLSRRKRQVSRRKRSGPRPHLPCPACTLNPAPPALQTLPCLHFEPCPARAVLGLQESACPATPRKQKTSPAQLHAPAPLLMHVSGWRLCVACLLCVQERIEPLYDRYNEPNMWRLSKRRG
jgi:hypothetical protein